MYSLNAMFLELWHHYDLICKAYVTQYGKYLYKYIGVQKFV